MAIDITDIGLCERKKLGDELPIAALFRVIGERWGVVPAAERPAGLSDIYPLDLDRYPTTHSRLAAIRDNIIALAPHFLNMDAAENDLFLWSMQPWYFDRDYIARSVSRGVLTIPLRGAGWGVEEERIYSNFLASAAYWLSRFRYRPAVTFVPAWWRKSASYEETRRRTEDADGAIVNETTNVVHESNFIWGETHGTSFVGGETETHDDSRSFDAIFRNLAADEYFEEASSETMVVSLPIEISGESRASRSWMDGRMYSRIDGTIESERSVIETAGYFSIGECPASIVLHNPTSYIADGLLCSGSGVAKVERRGDRNRPWRSGPYYHRASNRRAVETDVIDTDSNGIETRTFLRREEYAGSFVDVDSFHSVTGEPYTRTTTERTFDGSQAFVTRTQEPAPSFGGSPRKYRRIAREHFNESFGVLPTVDGITAHVANLGTISQRGRIEIPIVEESGGVFRIEATLACNPATLLAEILASFPEMPPFPGVTTIYPYEEQVSVDSEIWMNYFGTKLFPVLDFGTAYRVSADDELENWAGLSEEDWNRRHPHESNAG